jgi:hypothetical protein
MYRYNPYVVYNGKLAIKDNSVGWLRNAKDKLLYSKEVIKNKIESGEIIRVKNSERYGKCGLFDYDSLGTSLKMRLKIKYGLPPKIINE